MSHFDFKQFRIHHDRCAMKVGTDGVLLGAWANVKDNENILDIGTGTGLIALMLAQRANAHITGVEIDPEAAAQATQNASESPFSQQVRIVNTDIKDYPYEPKYDNIVSNPPFFKESVLPPKDSRATARHCAGLPLETLVEEAKKRLRANGLFQVILPHSEVSRFVGLCALKEMSLLRLTEICTKEGKPFKRALLCFINQIEATGTTRDILYLTGPDGGRSAGYQALTKDFYLEK